MLLLSRVMTRLRVAWCLVLLLQLGLQPCELRRASAKEAAVGKSKTARSKSADTARLKSEHPADPVKWFDQVVISFSFKPNLVQNFRQKNKSKPKFWFRQKPKKWVLTGRK